MHLHDELVYILHIKTGYNFFEEKSKLKSGSYKDEVESQVVVHYPIIEEILLPKNGKHAKQKLF